MMVGCSLNYGPKLKELTGIVNYKKSFKYIKQHKNPYLFIAPFFITYLAFQLYPQLYSFVLSFSEFKFGGNALFVGFQNFVDAWQDPVFWISIKNTAFFWIGTLPVQLLIAFIIASSMKNLSSKVRGRLSGFYYLPVVTNMVAVVLIFQLMFDQKFGVINYLLSFLGIGQIPWLASASFAKLSTIILITWRGLGYYVIYTLAGLMSVDETLYEYAKIEGANRFQKAFYITLPSIKPILLYQVFTGTITGWSIFLEPFLLFNKTGGPQDSCLTTSMYVYTEGFRNLKYGYGAAMSLMLALITTVFAIMQFKLFRNDNTEDM
jgi:lactose/L-arabinose transport system permease protein